VDTAGTEREPQVCGAALQKTADDYGIILTSGSESFDRNRKSHAWQNDKLDKLPNRTTTVAEESVRGPGVALQASPGDHEIYSCRMNAWHSPRAMILEAPSRTSGDLLHSAMVAWNRHIQPDGTKLTNKPLEYKQRCCGEGRAYEHPSRSGPPPGR
jgi:hypothetical protein